MLFLEGFSEVRWVLKSYLVGNLGNISSPLSKQVSSPL